MADYSCSRCGEPHATNTLGEMCAGCKEELGISYAPTFGKIQKLLETQNELLREQNKIVLQILGQMKVR
jgi:hypothetical protein